MAAKFFTGMPLDGPDPECVKGNAEFVTAGDRPAPSQDHSHKGTVRNAPVPVKIGRRPPATMCDESPVNPLDFAGHAG